MCVLSFSTDGVRIWRGGGGLGQEVPGGMLIWGTGRISFAPSLKNPFGDLMRNVILPLYLLCIHKGEGKLYSVFPLNIPHFS